MGFGHLQQSICGLLHTCKTSSLDKVQSLPLITITSLPTSQKHFDWAEKMFERKMAITSQLTAT